MLLAHLVPGYFAAALSQPRWQPRWRTEQRALLWIVALGIVAHPLGLEAVLAPVQPNHLGRSCSRQFSALSQCFSLLATSVAKFDMIHDLILFNFLDHVQWLYDFPGSLYR